MIDDLPVQHPGRHRGVMHVLEMGTVRSVFGHDLWVHRFLFGEPGELRIRPVIGGGVGFELRERGEDVRHFPLRRLAVRVMPDEHAVVLLQHREHPQGEPAVGPVGLIGDVSVGAVRAPAPAMERALDTIAHHRAAVPDVRAEVLAVRLEHVQLTGLVAVGGQILAEILQRPDVPGREFGGPPDHEPPGDLPGERNPHASASRGRFADTKSVTV